MLWAATCRTNAPHLKRHPEMDVLKTKGPDDLGWLDMVQYYQSPACSPPPIG